MTPRRTFAASVTPLHSDRDAVDIDAVTPLVDFYARSGIDGLLVLGTTGEGVLLATAERRAAAGAFVQSAAGRLQVIVHCGAQSTRETVALAEHAAACGAAGVAVIAPPYFAFDEPSLLAHFTAAAAACAPLPFFVYEFALRSGYAIPLQVIAGLRDSAPNLAGLKVSDTPFPRVQPYLLDGLDVFIGAEELIHDGCLHGAAGAVSGLAAAFPERVAAVVRDPSPEAAASLGRLRAELQRFPFHAALKRVLDARGVPVSPHVVAPLRDLDSSERAGFAALLDELLPSLTAPPSRSAALLQQTG